MNRKIGVLLFFLAIIIAAAGCSAGQATETAESSNSPGNVQPSPNQTAPANEPKQSEPEPVESNEPLEPVTLSVKVLVSVPVETEWQRLFIDPINEKFPHITLERAQGNLKDLLNAGEVPDLILNHNGVWAEYLNLDLFVDIDPFVKKHDIDLNRFDEVYLESLRDISENQELYALPYSANFTALYYNKDLFDQFAVPYPEDGMTWEDAAEVAERLSRVEDGMVYRGLDFEGPARLARQVGIDFVEIKTMKANLDNDDWRKIFEISKKIYTIPNNEPNNLLSTGALNSFIKDRSLAMMGSVNRFEALETPTKEGLNWDVAQFPSFSDMPNVSNDVDTHMLIPVKTSKYLDDVMRVLSVVTSDEVQEVAAKQSARLSPLKDPKFKEIIGADMAFLQDKQVDRVFKSHQIPAPNRTPYYSPTRDIAMKKFVDYVNGKDLNTAIREAEEEINSYLAAEAN